jgi:putative hydrolase of the HAD superfamily
MPIAAVTLDAAGTLIEAAEPVGVTYARIARRHGLRATVPARVERAFHAALAAAPPLAFPGTRPAPRARRERAWWRAIVHAALGAPPRGPAFAACFADLWKHFASAAAWRVFPEVPGVLAALRSRGLRLAVVSNFDRRLPPLLAALGLREKLDAVIHSTAVGAAKPDPAIFRAAAAALGVPLGDIVHVGDRLEVDVGGARAAGARAVLLDRHRRRPRVPSDVRTISTLAALPAVLAHAYRSTNRPRTGTSAAGA